MIFSLLAVYRDNADIMIQLATSSRCVYAHNSEYKNLHESTSESWNCKILLDARTAAVLNTFFEARWGALMVAQ